MLLQLVALARPGAPQGRQQEVGRGGRGVVVVAVVRVGVVGRGVGRVSAATFPPAGRKVSGEVGPVEGVVDWVAAEGRGALLEVPALSLEGPVCK